MDLATVIVTGFVTLIGSGLGTAVVNYWLTERKAKRDLRRTKLEELFLAVDAWAKLMGSHSVTIHSVMIGKLGYDQANDLIIDTVKSAEKTAGKMQMLINLYFTELKDDFEVLQESKRRLNATRMAHKQAYQGGENDPEFAAVFSAEIKRFDDAQKALKMHVARLASQMTRWK